MKDFRSAAQQYLADKGCKSNGQKYTAFEIVHMLNEFAQEQVKNCSIPDVVWRSEQLVCKGKCEHGYKDDNVNELFCSIKLKTK